MSMNIVPADDLAIMGAKAFAGIVKVLCLFMHNRSEMYWY